MTIGSFSFLEFRQGPDIKYDFPAFANAILQMKISGPERNIAAREFAGKIPP